MEQRSYSLKKMGFQYQCLTMSLQDGLDELKVLKCLRRLTLEKMSLGMGQAEQTWMKENWPEYGRESRDNFWTSRGHYIGFTDQLHENLGLTMTGGEHLAPFSSNNNKSLCECHAPPPDCHQKEKISARYLSPKKKKKRSVPFVHHSPSPSLHLSITHHFLYLIPTL